MPAHIGARRMEAAHTRLKGGGFNLAAFMASQSDGFWYDFGQTDRLFQDAFGGNPADDAGEVIGLALSSRLWNGRTLAQQIAQATELAVNGDFSGGSTGWTDASTAPATFAVTGGQGVLTSSGGSRARARQTAAYATEVGRSYRLALNLVSLTSSANLLLNVGTAAGGGQIANDALLSGAIGLREYFFTATTTTTFVQLANSLTGVATFDDLSVKEVSRYPATQATGTFKPTFQATGAKFDGTDDNLLTGYVAQAAASGNFLVARVSVPATLGGTQIIAGANDSGGANPFRLGITTAGALRATVGAGSTLDSTGIDLRGTETVVGLSYDGARVRIFAGQAQVGDFAETGAISTTVPFRLGSRNDNGTAATFFAGSIRSILAGRQALETARFNQIAAALLAA